MFDDEFFLPQEHAAAQTVFPSDPEGCEAFRITEIVMATLFPSRYPMIPKARERNDARQLQETLKQAMAA